MQTKLKAPLFFFFILLTVLSPLASASVSERVKVGVYFYTWYDPDEAVSWEYPKIMDKPVLGYYNSSDPETIATQLKQISDAHIDFLIVSWWGEDTFSDQTVKQLFAVARANLTNLKMVVMVESFNESVPNGYDHTAIYDYIYETFYEPYPTVYLTEMWNGLASKPVLILWNSEYLTGLDDDPIFPLDNRFNIRTVGYQPFCDWSYEQVRASKYNELGLTDWAPVRQIMTNQFPIAPRFMDTQFREPPTAECDITYSADMYKNQWELALNLAREGSIRYVTLASWNEYPERSAIEPHYDATAWTNDPAYIYNLTVQYVAELKNIDLPNTGAPWYNNPLVVVLVVVIAVICIILLKEVSV